MSTKFWNGRYHTGMDRMEYPWMRAFPLGNGRIGAMLFGDPDKEHLELNEESLWNGRPQRTPRRLAPADLQAIRQLIFEHRFDEAGALAKQAMTSGGARMSYEYFADLWIDFHTQSPYTDYRKELDLETGIGTVTWKRGNRAFCSESFVSTPHDVAVYRVDCTGGRFSATVSVSRSRDAHASTVSHDTLLLNGTLTWHGRPEMGIPGGECMSFGSRILVQSDGSISASDRDIAVEDATYLTVYTACETNYNPQTLNIDETAPYKSRLRNTIDALTGLSYEAVRKAHTDLHSSIFNRVRFELDVPVPDEIPLEYRLDRLKYQHQEDADLYTLYYHYGRYLLMASSGGRSRLPANLQGIWCDGTEPCWGSDFHLNINVQMNYWPAESANLSETAEPLIRFVKSLSEFGTENARQLYNARGWAVHIVSDAFGFTGCGGGALSMFVIAGPWLCMHLWEHYEYTRDTEYLKEIYPILKGACEFMQDFLTESPEGYLVTNPTNSPENSFFYTDASGNRRISDLTYGATMDNQILYALFTQTAAACDILEQDKDFAASIRHTLSRIPPLQISERYGTICEWIKDYEETEPGHRHISHLVGLYPGDQINENDPVLFEAAKKTFQRRLDFGSGHTGWSMAWFINFHARLKDAEGALNRLRALVREFAAYNLLDMHPPFPLFQIDGNFGGTAGITEMLLQSHLGTPENRVLEILPALPASWKQGRICGIKARGNFEVSIDWNAERIQVQVRSLTDNTLRVKCPAGTVPDTDLTDGLIVREMKQGETACFTFRKSATL